MKRMELTDDESVMWSVTLADAATRAPAGQFAIDGAYGHAAARFMQGVAKAAGSDMLFLTAQRGAEAFPVKFPCVSLLSYSAPSFDYGVLFDSVKAVYNGFVASGWEPVFETCDGRRRLVAEVRAVAGLQRQPQESASVIPPQDGRCGTRAAFREEF